MQHPRAIRAPSLNRLKSRLAQTLGLRPALPNFPPEVIGGVS